MPHYFKDKYDLLYEVCEEFAEHFFANLTNIRTIYPDPLEALQSGIALPNSLGTLINGFFNAASLIAYG